MQEQVRDIEFIRSIFEYNPETGVLLWSKRNDVPSWWNTRYSGKAPTARDKLGYLRAKISRDGWSGYVSAHRICFFIYHGYVPDVVDHIDGDVGNNKIGNLRAADFKTNTWNRGGNKGTETGYKGVKVIRKKGKLSGYVALIGHDGKREYLGFFKSAEDARDAYIKREGELRVEYARQ